MYGVSFDRMQIHPLLEDFHILTGIRIAFVSHDFRHLIAQPAESCRFCSVLRQDIEADRMCRECDKKAFEMASGMSSLYLYECHAGITEAVAPVIIDGRLSGYLMMGQTLHSDPSPETWEKTLQKCRSYKVDFIALEKAFYGLSRQKPEKLEAAARIMDRSAKYIHLSRLAKIHEMPLLEKVKAYVEQNLSREITIADLSRKLGFSSSHLSHSMKADLGVNLTQYVRSRRMEKAKQLLSETRLEIARIALEAGFEDPNYFTRIFKREAGVTPTEYRIINRKVAELC